MKPHAMPLAVMLYAGLLMLIGLGAGGMALFNPSSAIGYVDGADLIALGPVGRFVRRITLRENKLAIWLSLENLFKVESWFSDGKRKKTGLETL